MNLHFERCIFEDKIDALHDNDQNLGDTKLKRRRKKIKKTGMNAFGEYIDNCAHILVTIFLADVLRRFFSVLCEYFIYKNHYLPEDRLWTILCRAYCFNITTIAIYLCAIAIAPIRIICHSDVHSIFPPGNFFLYMPLWWLTCLARLDHSTLDYAMFIRGNHGLDSASSMAANFFHGYLKLTLPAYANSSGIKERIAKYEQIQDVRFAIDRLIILVPSKLFIKPKFESPYLEKAKPLEQVYHDRAGVFRPYKNDVYRFTKPISNRYYYLALEGATPILTFFETLNFSITRTKQIEEMSREILLKFCKHLKRLVYNWPETESEIELIFYNDYKPNGQKQDIGEWLYNHFESLILSNESENSTESVQNTTYANDGIPYG